MKWKINLNTAKIVTLNNCPLQFDFMSTRNTSKNDTSAAGREIPKDRYLHLRCLFVRSLHLWDLSFPLDSMTVLWAAYESTKSIRMVSYCADIYQKCVLSLQSFFRLHHFLQHLRASLLYQSESRLHIIFKMLRMIEHVAIGSTLGIK